MIEFGEVTIEKLIRSSRKTLSVEVNASGAIIVRAPLKMSLRRIQNFIEEKKSWLDRARQRLQKSYSQPLQLQFIENETFYYLGHRYPLKFNPLIKKITFHDNAFYVRPKSSELLKIELMLWYKNKAKKYFKELLIQEAKTMGLGFKTLKLSSAKKRWGSCSQEGNISLCWRLIMAPESVIRYVIIHELAHIREMNHSMQFWQIVKTFHPSYKNDKKWLHDSGHLLNWD